MMVKGNGKIDYKARRPEIPDILEVADIFYGKIIGYRRLIIKME
jgi:hypothetical protein